MKFEELSKEQVSKIEKKLMASWKNNRIFEKSIENREGKKDYVFYDGPATANGNPGLHHIVAKFLKDTFC